MRSRFRDRLGFVCGLLLIADAAAHSLGGWPQMRARLAAVDAPSDLVTRLAIGWHVSGAAILAFAVLVLWMFADRLRGRPVSLRPAVLIALIYVACAVGALLASGMNPIFTIFLVPGLLLLAASWDREAAPPLG